MTPKRGSLERAARYAPLGGRFGGRFGDPKRAKIEQKPGSYGNFSVCAPARVWRILEPLDPPGSAPELPWSDLHDFAGPCCDEMLHY